MCRHSVDGIGVITRMDIGSMASKHKLQKMLIVTILFGCATVKADHKNTPAPYLVTSSPAPGSLMYASSTSHDLIDEDFLRSSSSGQPQTIRKIFNHSKGKFTGIGRPLALLPPGQKRRRRIFNMMKHKLSKHKASAAHALARQRTQTLAKMDSLKLTPTVDILKTVMLNSSMHIPDKFNITTRKSITKSPPVYKPGPAIIKFAPDKDDFIRAGLLQNKTHEVENLSSKKNFDKFITTYRPNYVFKKLDKMPKKLQNMEGMSLYVESAYQPVYINHPLMTRHNFMRNDDIFRNYNVSDKHKSYYGGNVHGAAAYHKPINDGHYLYPPYKNTLSPTASSYIPPAPLIPPKMMIHHHPHVMLPSPNTYKLSKMNNNHKPIKHHHVQPPRHHPVHQPVLHHNVHPTHHGYRPPQDMHHVYYSQPSRGYHLTNDPYQRNSYLPVPRKSFEIIPTHYGYSNRFQPSSHKPVYKKIKSYAINKKKTAPKYSISFLDEQNPNHRNISLSSKIDKKLISHIRPLANPKIIRPNNLYEVYPETTTISSKNYRISDKRTKYPVIRDVTTASPLEYITPKYHNVITPKQPVFTPTSTPYPYTASLEGLYHNKISKSKKKLRRIPGIPGVALTDYPVHNGIPITPFTCLGKVNGYYADLHAQCQVFHRCQYRGQKNSFLCPNGTLFNQRVLTCDHWRNVDCENSYKHYEVNRKLFKFKRMTNYDKKLKDFSIGIPTHGDIDEENSILGSSELPEVLKVKYIYSKKVSRSTTQPSFRVETKSSTVSKSPSVNKNVVLVTPRPGNPNHNSDHHNQEEGIVSNVDRIGMPVVQFTNTHTSGEEEDVLMATSKKNNHDHNHPTHEGINRIGVPLAGQHHNTELPNTTSQTTTRSPVPETIDLVQLPEHQHHPSDTTTVKYYPVIRTNKPHIINPVKVKPYLP